MPEIPVPPEARKAAHDATSLPLAEALRTSPYELIDIALAAAAPAIRAAEHARIVALADAWKCSCGEESCTALDGVQTFADELATEGSGAPSPARGDGDG